MGQCRKNNKDFIGLRVSDTLDNLDVQDCVLAVPSSPLQLTFALGQQGQLSFFQKTYADHPGFNRFRAPGSL